MEILETTCCKLVVSFVHGRMVLGVQHFHALLSTTFVLRYEYYVFRQQSSKIINNDVHHGEYLNPNDEEQELRLIRKLTNEYGEFKYSSVASNSTGLGLNLL